MNDYSDLRCACTLTAAEPNDSCPRCQPLAVLADRLKWRTLPAETDRRGVTWTPKLPRTYRVQGRDVRLGEVWRGPQGTLFASVHCLTAPIPVGFPEAVRCDTLTEVRCACAGCRGPGFGCATTAPCVALAAERRRRA